MVQHLMIVVMTLVVNLYRHKHQHPHQHQHQQHQQQQSKVGYNSSDSGQGSERPQYHNGGHVGPTVMANSHRKGAVRGQEIHADADFSLDAERLSSGIDKRTTLMIRNIPNKYTQISVLEEINANHQGEAFYFHPPLPHISLIKTHRP